MASCNKIHSSNRSVCIGNMDRLIALQSRTLTAPTGGDSDYEETMVTIASVYALVETPGSDAQFGSISLPGSPVFFSHTFYIRYRADVTNETFILMSGIYYDILHITNLEETNRFLKLDCARSGPSTAPASVVRSSL